VSAQNTILKTAQENPAPLEGLRTAFAIGETELEVKLIFEETGGATDIRLVSAGKSRLPDLDPGVLSSLKAKILAVPDEEPTAPKRSPTQIRDEVLVRPTWLACSSSASSRPFMRSPRRAGPLLPP
jgi:hypothetical protein